MISLFSTAMISRTFVQVFYPPKKDGNSPMKNPWIKKNPLWSTWWSGTNAIAGTARGCITAAGERQMTTMLTRSTKEMGELWMSALYEPRTATRTRKHRRRRVHL